MRRGADLVNAGCWGLSRLHMDGHWNEDNLLLRRWRMLMVMNHVMRGRCLYSRELRVRWHILLVDEGGVVGRLGTAHFRRQEAR